VVQIVESRAIESTDDIHDIIEDHRLVERPLLRYYTCRVHCCPLPILNLVGEEIVKPLLARVDPSEDENGLLHGDCGVAVAGFRPYTLKPSNLEPQFRREAILVNVVHRIVSVPPANDKH